MSQKPLFRLLYVKLCVIIPRPLFNLHAGVYISFSRGALLSSWNRRARKGYSNSDLAVKTRQLRRVSRRGGC